MNDEQQQGEPQKVVLTVDSRGNIRGDTSNVDPHILAQMSTPEAQAQIRQMYKDRNGGGRRELRKELIQSRRMLVEGEQRYVKYLVPPGMSKSDAKRQRRKWTKAAIKQQAQGRQYGQ